MKNVQIVDGAVNSLFEIYEVSDELFELVFPDNKDVAFLDDLEQAFQERGIGEKIWDTIYQKQVNKREVIGIHGTLHLTGSNCRKEYFPTGKEAEVVTSLKS